MVLSAGVPYKRTLLACTQERQATLATPLHLYATAQSTTTTAAPHAVYTLSLRVPSVRALARLDLVHLDVDTAASPCEAAVYMQPLDDAGRAYSTPMPLCARCPARVTVPLHTGDRVRLFVVVMGGALCGLRIGCNAQLASGGALDTRSPVAQRLQRWRDAPRHLVAVTDAHTASAHTQGTQPQQHDDDDDVPQLLYANVDGGDDES